MENEKFYVIMRDGLVQKTKHGILTTWHEGENKADTVPFEFFDADEITSWSNYPYIFENSFIGTVSVPDRTEIRHGVKCHTSMHAVLSDIRPLDSLDTLIWMKDEGIAFGKNPTVFLRCAANAGADALEYMVANHSEFGIDMDEPVIKGESVGVWTACESVLYGYTGILRMMHKTGIIGTDAFPKIADEAASRNNADAIRYLAGNGLDLKKHGNALFKTAIELNRGDAVKALFECGADIYVSSIDDMLMSSLWFIVVHDSSEIFFLLLEKGADINAKNGEILQRAVNLLPDEDIKKLLQYEAQFNIGMAANAGNYKILKWILACGLDKSPDYTDAFRKLSLSGSKNTDRYKIAEFLTGKGADIAGNAPEFLANAVRAGNYPVARYVLKHNESLHSETELLESLERVAKHKGKRLYSLLKNFM